MLDGPVLYEPVTDADVHICVRAPTSKRTEKQYNGTHRANNEKKRPANESQEGKNKLQARRQE